SFLGGGKTLLAVLVVLICAACWRTFRDHEKRRVGYRHVIFFSGYFILPIAMVFAASNLLEHYSFFVQRYFLPFVFGVVVLAGLSLLRVNRVFATLLLIAFTVAPVIRGLRHSHDETRPYSEAAAQLPAVAAPDQVTLHASPLSYFPFAHYDGRWNDDRGFERILWSKAAGASFTVRINLISGLIHKDELVEI